MTTHEHASLAILAMTNAEHALAQNPKALSAIVSMGRAAGALTRMEQAAFAAMAGRQS